MAWLRFRLAESLRLFFQATRASLLKSWPVRVILVLIVFGASFPASAQEPESRFEIFGQFGGSFYTDKSELVQIPFLDITTGLVVFFPTRRTSSHTTTGRLFTGIRYYFTRNNAVEASYSYSPSDLSETDLVMGSLGVSEFVLVGQVRASFASFNYVRYVKPNGRWRSFVTGGLGFAHFNGLTSPTKFSGSVGAGTDIDLHRRFALRAEYRLFLMARPKLSPVFVLGGPGSPGGVLYNHVPSVGLVFKF